MHNLPARVKPIPEFPGYFISRQGGVWNRYGRKLRPGIIRGYPTAKLFKNKKVHNRLVHRLIAQAFLPNPNNLPLVCHKNDIKTDNRIRNLQWGTSIDNFKDAIKNNKHGTKLTPEKVLIIRKALEFGISQSSLATHLNIPISRIIDIRLDRSWRWLKRLDD
jgi:hypothetical protein